MDSIDSYTIKTKSDYVVLQDIAEEKFYNNVVVYVKQIIFAAALVIISLFLISFFNFSPYVFVIVYNIIAWFGCVGLVLSVIIFVSSARKIRRQAGIYKGDLRRIQEKMTYSDIYMDIPFEDMHKFDRVWGVVKASVKRMKKRLEK